MRIVVVNASTGDVQADSMASYSRWSTLQYCNASRTQFRQHPLDYIEAFEEAMRVALSKVSESVTKSIVAISIATTGSTPVAVNKEGIPLALTKGFEENPNAMFVLWKDHCAVREAAEINGVAHASGAVDYTKYSGGEYSSEWFWAKMLHVMRHDEAVREAAYSWVEHCDWMPALLTGNTNPITLKRSRCAAGHKAMWNAAWNGLPSDEFLSKVDPLLVGMRGKLYTETYTSDIAVGTLSQEWAQRLGLTKEVIVGTGTLDAHMGAIGGEIKPYQLIKVIGTSTCDMMIVPKAEMKDTVVTGICGQVDGSIIPDMIGLEAGQSAFGDIYAWLRSVLCWPTEHLLSQSTLIDEKTKQAIVAEMYDRMIPELSIAADKIPIDESGLVAIDWMNGRRTPHSNQNLKGAVSGLTLSTDAPKLFRAMVEATAFGSKKIVEAFREAGVKIEGVIAVGGVAQKSDFVMQILSDVLDSPIRVVKAQQTCALGAAMAAAVVANIYDTFEKSQRVMGLGFEKEYTPIEENVKKYNYLYKRYAALACFIEDSETAIN